MAYDTQDDLSNMTGGALREKLEETIKQNRQLQEQLASRQAKDVLVEKGFDLVKPEDLKGVDPDKIEARAQEIQAERQALQADLLRSALEKQGFKGTELEDMVEDVAAQRQTAQQGAEAVNRVRSLGNNGTPVPDVDPSKLHGYDAVRTALENPKRSRS